MQQQSPAPTLKQHLPHRRHLKTLLYSTVSLIIFGLSLHTLGRQLRGYAFEEILAGFSGIPPLHVIGAGFMTIGGYLVLTFYDLIAFRATGSSLRYYRVALTTFVSAVISANLGFSFLTSVPLRLRLYTNYGISPPRVGKIIILNTVTFWLGYSILGGVYFSFFTRFLPAAGPLKESAITATGVLLLCSAILYFILSICKLSITVRGRTLRVPSLRICLSQAVVSSLDWFTFAAILYLLIPPGHGISLFTVVGAYLFAQALGLISNVPGGLGVFETAIMYLMAPAPGTPRTMAVLLAYRLIVHVVPFIVALGILAIHELRHARRGKSMPLLTE